MKALVVGTKVFEVIDRTPQIKDDPLSSISTFSFKDKISFKDIKFRYPT